MKPRRGDLATSPARLMPLLQSVAKKESRMRQRVGVARILMFAGLGFLGMAWSSAAQGPAAIVLKAARVFTATADRPLSPGMVIVEGDHITKVGTNLAVPPGAQVIDLGDSTLLPGFIDAHVHLSM